MDGVSLKIFEYRGMEDPYADIERFDPIIFCQGLQCLLVAETNLVVFKYWLLSLI